MKALINAIAPAGALANKATVLGLVNRYKNVHHAILKNSTPSVDNTVYVWFSIEALQKFLEDMAKENASGVRVYFGAVDAQGTNRHNKQTVAFVCTRQVGETDCQEELIDDDGTTPDDGYDFGSLCPPECNHCACGDDKTSIAKEVFGDGLCQM